MKRNDNSHLEIEVKFHIKDVDCSKALLAAAGAISGGEIHERNIRYDDRNLNLLKSGCLLRLRKTDRTVLTFKKPPEVKNTDFKIHIETEVEVSDFDNMEAIIEELGYFRVQSYEKYRETFTFNDTQILVDRMPYGNFIEIEGSMESIKKCADILKLDWSKRITLNYLEIFERISKRMNLDFRDITFENFNRLGNSFSILHSDYL
jgi:adenylate cyclase class 2